MERLYALPSDDDDWGTANCRCELCWSYPPEDDDEGYDPDWTVDKWLARADAVERKAEEGKG